VYRVLVEVIEELEKGDRRSDEQPLVKSRNHVDNRPGLSLDVRRPKGLKPPAVSGSP
jgi:hypothetical protein